MMTVETIGRIRRAFLVEKKPIRQIVRELRISRQTVRKAIRGHIQILRETARARDLVTYETSAKGAKDFNAMVQEPGA